MITLLIGDNSYEIEQELDRIEGDFDGEPEKFDGENLELKQLPDLLSGQSLFTENRLVIIRELSKNKPLWETLEEWLDRVSNTTHLVLVDPTPDKRTKTYKALQRNAEVKEFQLFGERDAAAAQRWLVEEAKRLNVKLDTSAARELLQRSYIISSKGQPVVDQWAARHALEKLSVFDAVTAETVQKYIDDQPINSVFSIFETALRGDQKKLHQLLEELEPREDAFRVFGLLSGQVFQLATLAASDAPTSDTAKAIGVHPYAAGKLAAFAKKLSREQVKAIVLVFTEADEDMKLSKAEPWALIERALVKTIRAVNGN